MDLSYFAYPVLGVVAMFLFCFSLGILCWLLERQALSELSLFHRDNQCNCGSWFTLQITGRKSFKPLDLGPSPTGMLSSLPSLVLAY